LTMGLRNPERLFPRRSGNKTRAKGADELKAA
jgi:hypothetical protein